MTKKKTVKYRNAANPERAKAMHELRRSNAAVPHQHKKNKRENTREAVMNKILKDYQ